MTSVHANDFSGAGAAGNNLMNSTQNQNQNLNQNQNQNLNQNQNHNIASHENLLWAKLQEMVPKEMMPREDELSELEIINCVIDYIRQLSELAKTTLDNNLPIN